MSKTWGKIGAWAAEAERAEDEEREAAAVAAAPGTTAPAVSHSFPSLKEAVSTKPKKKKMTLSEFNMGTFTASSAPDYSYSRLTPDEMLRLPTAPRERSAEEMQHGRFGGGFSSYGRPARTTGVDDRSDSWGGANRRPYGGFDEEKPQRRGGPPPRVSDLDQPSRADEVDNWAIAKKPFQPLHSQETGRQSRYGGLGSGSGFSRADEVDNWTADKKPVMPTRSSTFGSGFAREPGPEPDRWTRGGSGSDGSRLNLEVKDTMVVNTNKPNPFGAARPREEVLAEKGLDWKKLEMESETKKAMSRPTSSHSSRPSSAQSSRSESLGLQGLENVVKQSRPKVNPFGNAKPREVSLEDWGQDWRKIDPQLDRNRVDRSETEGEKVLKEEIVHLKKELEMNKESLQEFDEEKSSLHDTILSKEQELEMLVRDVDSKVRFGPGPGAGRAYGYPERPSSQSRSFDESSSMESLDRPHSRGMESRDRPHSRGMESRDRPHSRGMDSMDRPHSRGMEFMERPRTRGMDFMDRPRSRGIEFMDRPRSGGMGDAWARPGDDRRPLQGGRERGFQGSRDLDRQSSRERW